MVMFGSTADVLSIMFGNYKHGSILSDILNDLRDAMLARNRKLIEYHSSRLASSSIRSLVQKKSAWKGTTSRALASFIARHGIDHETGTSINEFLAVSDVVPVTNVMKERLIMHLSRLQDMNMFSIIEHEHVESIARAILIRMYIEGEIDPDFFTFLSVHHSIPRWLKDAAMVVKQAIQHREGDRA